MNVMSPNVIISAFYIIFKRLCINQCINFYVELTFTYKNIRVVTWVT